MFIETGITTSSKSQRGDRWQFELHIDFTEIRKELIR